MADMDFSIVENNRFVHYRRSGSCKQCGKCCCTTEIRAQVQVTTDDADKSNRSGPSDLGDLSDWEGFSVFCARGLWWWIKIEVTDEPQLELCSAFIDGRCNCWNTVDWPVICEYWPVHPMNLERFPDCGFSFERIEQE